MSSIFQGLVQSSTGLVNFSVGTGAIPIIAAEMRGLRINAVADAEGAFPVYASVGQASASVGSGGLSFDAYGRLRITTTVPGTIVQLPGGIIADETGSLVVFGPAEILYQGVALTYIGYVSALSQEPVPIFYWPGTHTLAATTGTTPTFTRATSATFEDFEGVIRTAESSEPRFVGARRVENLVPASEDFTNVGWVKSPLNAGVTPALVDANYGTITDGDGNVINQQRWTFEAGGTSGADRSRIYSHGSMGVGESFSASVWLSVVSGTQDMVFSTANTWVYETITLTTTPQRFSVEGAYGGAAPIASTATVFLIQATGDVSGAAAFDVIIGGAQSENVTGQTNQNPSEYVSTGVGTGAELVTGDSATFENGIGDWVAGTNTSLSAVGGRLRTENTATTEAAAWLIVPTVAGLTYTCSIEFIYSGTPTQISVGTVPGSTAHANSGTLSASTTYSASFTATSIATYITVFVKSTTLAAFVEHANISVKQASHGANIDGVQYFNTLNANTVTANVVTEATGSALTSATTQFGELHGGGGDYFSTPSVVTTWSELDIRVRATRSTTSNNVFMFNKAAGATRDFELYVTTTGALNFQYWDSSGTLRYTTTTSLIPFAVGELGWCRVTIDTATGDIKLYTADGNLEAPAISDYTQLGATQNPVGGATSLRDTPLAGYSVGAITAYPIYPFDGDIYRAQVFNEIDGTTPVVDFTPGSYVSGSTLVSSTSGETWTLNGNASVFQPPVDASGPFGYLAEGARTNLCLYSEDFTTSNWLQSVTVQADQATAPDGTLTADKVTGASSGRLYQNITVLASTDYTFSLWVNSVDMTTFPIQAMNASGLANILTVDVISSLTVGAFSRVELSFNTGTATSVRLYVGCTGSSGGWILGEQAYLWGAQLEQSTYPTSYIATAAAAVTRNADTLLAGDMVTDAAGSGYVEVSQPDGVTANAYALNRSALGRILYKSTTAVNDNISAYDGTNGSDAPNGPSRASTPISAVSTWGDALTAYYNAAPDATPAAYDGTMGTGNLGIGNNQTGSEQWNGTVREVKIFDEELTAAEVADL